MLPVGTCIGADQHAPEGASLMIVLFTSFTVPAAVPNGIEIGDTPGLDGCRSSDSIEEGPTVKAAARCMVRSRLVATEPQWPRMKLTVARSLRTRHSRVIPKIGLRALRFGRFRPSSLPRFAASDDGHFAAGELPARPTGLSCDSHHRCLPPSLPMRQGCRFRTASRDLHCKSVIRIGRTTVIKPTTKRIVVESWPVRNYSKWNNCGRRGRLTAKFHFFAFGLELRRRTGSRSGSLPPSCANCPEIVCSARPDSGGCPRWVSTSALWCTMPITSISAGTTR